MLSPIISQSNRIYQEKTEIKEFLLFADISLTIVISILKSGFSFQEGEIYA